LPAFSFAAVGIQPVIPLKAAAFPAMVGNSNQSPASKIQRSSFTRHALFFVRFVSHKE
jgi:hypothetical protein